MKKLQILILVLWCKNALPQTWYQVGLGANLTPWCFLEDTINHIWYVGGQFTSLNGQLVSRIGFSTDGFTFSQVGNGFNGPVFALAMYNGELYAGGNFTMSGGTPVNNIAKWNGVSWQAVGGGAQSLVQAMEVYAGNLYVGGQFGVVSGVPNTVGIAKWNGSVWTSVGGGTSGFQTFVYTLKVYNGELYAAGSFYFVGGLGSQGIARWNGLTWLPVKAPGTGADGPIYALIVYGNKLIAGGGMNIIDGVITYNIASWDGSIWLSIGNVTNPPVYCFAMYNSLLYAGGNFVAIGSTEQRVAVYNGLGWGTVGAGFADIVYALGSFNGHLYAGGVFTFSGAMPIQHFAVLDAPSLPVTLINFSCEEKDVGALLSWQTASEVNADYFVVSRASVPSLFVKVGRVSAHGTTSLQHSYSLIDTSTPNGNLLYQLEEYDYDGHCSGTWQCALSLNGGKPFFDQTSSEIVVPKSRQNTEVILYDEFGRIAAISSGVSRIKISAPFGFYSAYVRSDYGSESVIKCAVTH